MLSEGNYTSEVSSDQTPEQQALVKKVLYLYDIAKKAKDKKHQIWREHWEFFLGRQWESPRPSYRASEVLNYTFAAIQSALPILTDNRPRFSYLPENPEDQELAEYFDKVVESLWTREGWNQVVQDLYLTGMIFGTSIGSCKWDPEGNSGLGRVRFMTVDPYHFFPAPSATEINDGSCPWLIEAKPIPMAKAKAMFPSLADKIIADVTPNLPSRYSQQATENIEAARIINFPSGKNESYSAFGEKISENDQCMIYELWIDDDTMEEFEQQCKDDLGNPLYTLGNQPKMEKGSKKKYPDGRHVVVIAGQIAYDDNTEYKDGKYPYAKFVDYQLPNEFWGMGEVDMLKSPNRIINRVVSATMDNLVIMGNPIWVADQGAVDAEELTNAPGLIVEKIPGSEVRREPGLPLPNTITELFDQALQSFDRIFGSNEVSQGQRPAGITAGVALESLQEAAQTRLRLKARNMENTLQQLGTLFLSRIMQYFTVPTWVSLNPDGAPPEIFQFQIEKEGEASGWYVATIQKHERDSNGQVVPSEEQKKYRTKGLFDVRVTVGSNLPFAKKTKAESAKQLFQLGVIDDEELLKSLEWPDWQALLARMNQKRQLAAAEQAKAQAQSGGQKALPPGPAPQG